MNRIEAVNLFKELQSKIPQLSPQAVSIMGCEPDNSSSTGCTIRLRGLCTDCKEQVKEIAKNNFLVFEEQGNDLMIYTPNVVNKMQGAKT
jgi:hypothetical protein